MRQLRLKKGDRVTPLSKLGSALELKCSGQWITAKTLDRNFLYVKVIFGNEIGLSHSEDDRAGYDYFVISDVVGYSDTFVGRISAIIETVHSAIESKSSIFGGMAQEEAVKIVLAIIYDQKLNKTEKKQMSEYCLERYQFDPYKYTNPDPSRNK